MVPDPSIKSVAMPLSALETEGAVWYMTPDESEMDCEAAAGREGAVVEGREHDSYLKDTCLDSTASNRVKGNTTSGKARRL